MEANIRSGSGLAFICEKCQYCDLAPDDEAGGVTADNQKISIIDVLKVKVAPLNQEDSEAAVKTTVVPKSINTTECDILIIGGGTAGVAAALAASVNTQLKICLTEETDWLGGQMTSQGVPITDDGRNFQVDTSGSNRSYQRLRQSIRDYYKKNYKLSPKSLELRFFNPGNCWYWVSQLAFQPEVALLAIENLLAPSKNESKLAVYLRHAPAKVESASGEIKSVQMINLDTGEWVNFKAKYYVDATELGELLPLSGASYSSGVESQAETGEPSAPVTANSEAVQDYTYPFIVEFVPGTQNTIPKPALYEHFVGLGRFSLLNYKMFGHGNKKNSDGVIISELMPFWTYRRLLDKSAFQDERIGNDMAVINWYSNDFQRHNVIDKEPYVVSKHLSMAKALSLSFLYWLQTEAPRDEGGTGYPELRLVQNALGTDDGLSKYPYIRESRRGRAITVIKEQDIKTGIGDDARARLFNDSVGIGFFPIDIHGQEVDPGALRPTKPFQFPLGALILDYPSNLVLSCKNIGATHITSAAYRLHPIEWGIGEASGMLAAFAIEQNIKPHKVLENLELLHAFQYRLIKKGVPVYWYDDVPTDHPNFEAIQLLAVLDIMRGDAKHLHFYPQRVMSADEARSAFNKAVQMYGALDRNLENSMILTTRSDFAFWLYSQLQALVFEVPFTFSNSLK
jgi:hypothetical protein